MRITVHPSVICLLCVFCAFAGVRLTAAFLTACLAHEAGHLLCMAVYGIPVRYITLTPPGAVIGGDFSHTSFAREASVHLAGISVNVLCAALLSFSGDRTGAAPHLLLAVYNFLPFQGNDGLRAIAALAGYGSPLLQQRVLRVLHAVTVCAEGVWYIFCAWLLWYGIVVSANAGLPGGTVLCGGLFLRALYMLLRRSAPRAV